MAKKKFYAVRRGLNPGIYETWAECERQTKGFSGAKYKSFESREAAERYLQEENDAASFSSETEESIEQINTQIDQEISALKEKEVIAFVDGSYNSKLEKSGFDAIILDDKGLQFSLYKAFTKELSADFLKLRNVAAELEGVKAAVNWAIQYEKKQIFIYYDYVGIENWADGTWQAKTDITRQYASFIRESRKKIIIRFCKVPAHTGVSYNEMADQLAKHSILKNSR